MNAGHDANVVHTYDCMAVDGYPVVSIYTHKLPKNYTRTTHKTIKNYLRITHKVF